MSVIPSKYQYWHGSVPTRLSIQPILPPSPCHAWSCQTPPQTEGKEYSMYLYLDLHERRRLSWHHLSPVQHLRLPSCISQSTRSILPSAALFGFANQKAIHIKQQWSRTVWMITDWYQSKFQNITRDVSVYVPHFAVPWSERVELWEIPEVSCSLLSADPTRSTLTSAQSAKKGYHENICIDFIIIIIMCCTSFLVRVSSRAFRSAISVSLSCFELFKLSMHSWN